MKQKTFSLAHNDPEMLDMIKRTDQKVLARWAIDCAERVLPYFENKFPEDNRPRKALEILQRWIETGEFKMAVIRKASLDSHAAAREVGEDNSARSAARAAGQAVATAHVPVHSYGSAVYAQQAIYRANDPLKAEVVVKAERNWQFRHLNKLINAT